MFQLPVFLVLLVDLLKGRSDGINCECEHKTSNQQEEYPEGFFNGRLWVDVTVANRKHRHNSPINCTDVLDEPRFV